MKTTTFLLLLFFSSLAAFSQDNTCLLKYMVGNYGYYQDNTRQELCKGGRLKISCQSIPEATYQWKRDGIIIPNENKQIFYATEEGVYTAEAQTNDCRYISPKITFVRSARFDNYGIELNNVYASINSNEFSICPKGEFFNININYNIYYGEIEYQWQKDGVDIEGAKSRGLFINKDGVYSVRARQGECLSHTTPVKIIIKNGNIISPMRLSPSISNFTPNQKDTLFVCENTGIDLESIYSPFTKHKWYKDDKLIEGFEGKWVSTKESGIYTYKTTLPYGCEVESEKYVVSFGKKIIKPTIKYSESFSGCFGNYLTVSGNLLFGNYIESIEGEYKIDWFKNSAYKNSGTNSNIDLTESALYKVAVNIGSCSAEDTFMFDPAKPILFKIANNLINNGKITMCAGNKAGLRFSGQLSVGYTKLQWYKDNQAIDKDIAVLNVSESGRYYATLSDIYNSCVKYSDTIEVAVSKSPAIQFDIQMQNNCTYRLVTGGMDGLTYAWKKDNELITGANKYEFFPKESGNYSLITNVGYCSYESRVRSVELLVKSAITEKNSFCVNDTLKLKALKAESYSWQGPDNFVSNIQNPQLALRSTNNSGLYRLTAIIEGCSYKDSVAIKVNTGPKASIERADEFCLGKNIIMIAKSESYLNWITPKKNNYYTSEIIIANADKSDNGIYILKATDYRSGCTTIISTEVILKESDCNAIQLLKPDKALCAYRDNELAFKLDGSFPPDETFNLYYISIYGDKQLIASTNKSPFKLSADSWLPHRLIIESSKTKILSNLIEVNAEIVYYNIERYYESVCNGYSVPIKIDSVNFKYDKIQWLKDSVEIPNANKYSYNATVSGNYWVRLERNGCVSIDSVGKHVDVKIGEIDSPYINTESSIMNICDGYSIRFDASQNNLKDARYQWLLNGNSIPDANKNFYLAKKQGIYSLRISQGTCEAVSGGSKVIVDDLTSPYVSISPYNRDANNIIEICDGTELNFISRTYLTYDWENPQIVDGIKFQWQKDDVDIPMATSYAYKTKEVGRYRLKVSQGDCIVFSELIIVKIGTPKILNLSINYEEFCIGDNVKAYVDGIGGIENSSLYSKIYRDGKFFVESQNRNSFKIQESGKYNAVLNFTVPGSTKTCTAYSDTLSIVFKDKLVNYKITGISSRSTCLDSLFITGGDWAGKKQWKLNGISIPDANDYTIMAKQSGAYQLETQTNSGCIYLSEPVNVEFNKLDIKISKYYPVCYDSLQVLNASINSVLYFFGDNYDYVSKPYSLEWQLDGKAIGKGFDQFVSKPGNYSLTMKQGACTATTSLLIDNNAFVSSIPKTLTPNQDSLVVCINTYATVSAPKGDFTYTWLKDNQPFENNNTQTIKVAAVGSYKVWIEGGGCARMSNSIALKENKSLVTATISGNKELMSGDSTRIKIDLTSLPPWIIKLTNNQEFTANMTPFEFAVKPLQTTVYELASVKNDCGVGTVSGKAEIKIIILGNEELVGAKINLYPVPTQGICQLSVETSVTEKLGFQLYNVEGKMLMKSEESKSGRLFNEMINLESMPDGVYVLKIKVGAKVVSRKIIKGN